LTSGAAFCATRAVAYRSCAVYLAPPGSPKRLATPGLAAGAAAGYAGAISVAFGGEAAACFFSSSTLILS